MIEQLITRLVREAPDLDAQVIAQLTTALRANGAPLALSIARVVELVADHLIDAGIALPALAMACGTLVDPRLTDREREAARNEIETLLPMPAGAKRFAIPAEPDVPLSALKRRLN
ncbi:MAG: hypothetical protein SFX73_31010 [Kofleriaceae bacterium]|nr:hypothetical protein [Kofleriaceae bacterium]